VTFPLAGAGDISGQNGVDTKIFCESFFLDLYCLTMQNEVRLYVEVCSKLKKFIFAWTIIALLTTESNAESSASVRIADPADGQYIEGGVLSIHFTTEDAPPSSVIALFFFDREIHRTEKKEDILQLNVAEIANVQLVQIECRLVALEESDMSEIVLASDQISVFLLGDAVVAPSHLDEDDHSISAYESAFEAALELKRQKAFNDARSKLEELLTLVRNIPHAIVPRIYMELGSVLLALEDVEGALLAYRDAVWHTPTWTEAHHYIAAILIMQENSQAFKAARRGDERGLIEQHLRTYRRLGGERQALPRVMAPRRHRVDRVGLMMVGSGAYARFFKPHVLSAERYLFRGRAEMHYYVFTDAPQAIEADMNQTIPWRCAHRRRRRRRASPSAPLAFYPAYLPFPLSSTNSVTSPSPLSLSVPPVSFNHAISSQISRLRPASTHPAAHLHARAHTHTHTLTPHSSVLHPPSLPIPRAVPPRRASLQGGPGARGAAGARRVAVGVAQARAHLPRAPRRLGREPLRLRRRHRRQVPLRCSRAAAQPTLRRRQAPLPTPRPTAWLAGPGPPARRPGGPAWLPRVTRPDRR
jgi:tetratricopeptide (TPR) repeat protein